MTLRPRETILTFAIAALVFWIAFDGGSYGIESRATLAIAAWWTVLMAVVLGLWPLARPPRAAWLAGAFLAGLALFTAASMAWAESAERAFTEFNRVGLYLAVFVVAVLAGTRGNVGRWSDAIAIAVAATGLLALTTRLFPDVLPRGEVPEFLPGAFTRLSYPVEYWNGLAILIAIGFPLLFRAATADHAAVWRGLAIGAFPALAAAMYLTSSRGGFATALVATVAFLTLTPRRWPAAAAVTVALLGSAASISVLLQRRALVNDPFESPVAADEGRSAALLILVICTAAGLVYAVSTLYLAGIVRVPSFAGHLAVILVVLAGLVGIAASDPVERFETFKAPPTAVEETDLIRAHLLSGNGSGRWQFWGAAADQFESRPLVGQGAGSWEAWWTQHGSIAMFTRDAHSLYLETLGELGIVGFTLIAGAFLMGLVSGVRRLLASEGDERLCIAAVLAAFVAYAVAAGVDWMWELTVVSIIGVALLGFLTGPATAPAQRPRVLPSDAGDAPKRWRFAAGAAALATGWLLICAQIIPLLAGVKISDSQAAAREGDAEQAIEDAASARNIQPWAASPYLQLALVQEAIGNLDGAEESIREAIDRDPVNWRLWLVAARIETRAGEIATARTSLRRAAELNPRSPLFANVE
ncbi:MAG: O-antigen ligase family protein [Actinomycetota bacterium]|nr:O-antigen ligase family protein [Actinomycetota bacterium]